MSFFKGRETSQVSIDMVTNELVIIDDARYYRLIQIFITAFGILPFIWLVLKDYKFSFGTSFFISFFIGAFTSLILYVIYFFLFKSTVAARIPVGDLKELLVFNLLFTGDYRLSIELQNGKYRNLIVNENQSVDSFITLFKAAGILVNRRSKYHIYPFNY